MKHRPKDISIQGVPMKQCKSCETSWTPAVHEQMMKENCPARGARRKKNG